MVLIKSPTYYNVENENNLLLSLNRLKLTKTIIEVISKLSDVDGIIYYNDKPINSIVITDEDLQKIDINLEDYVTLEMLENYLLRSEYNDLPNYEILRLLSVDDEGFVCYNGKRIIESITNEELETFLKIIVHRYTYDKEDIDRMLSEISGGNWQEEIDNIKLEISRIWEEINNVKDSVNNLTTIVNQHTISINTIEEKILNIDGVSVWSQIKDYEVPVVVFGSDNNLYLALNSSGPNFPSGPKNPITETNYWGPIGAGAGYTPVVVQSNYSAKINEYLAVVFPVATTSIIITMPSNPIDGDVVIVHDILQVCNTGDKEIHIVGNGRGLNNVTVKSAPGEEETLIFNIPGAYLRLVYNNNIKSWTYDIGGLVVSGTGGGSGPTSSYTQAGIAKLARNSDISSIDTIVSPAWIDANKSVIAEAIRADMPNWNSSSNYVPNELAYGTDNILYQAIVASGPSTAHGPQNPIDGTSNTEIIAALDWSTLALDIEPWASSTFGLVDGNKIFVAVGGKRISYSPDGYTWVSTNISNLIIDTDEEFSSVAYGDGRFIVTTTKPHSNHAYYSDNGIQWNTMNVPVFPVANGDTTYIAYGNNTFTIINTKDVSDGYIYYTYSTTKGESWNPLGRIPLNIATDLKFDGEKFIVTGNGYVISTNGISWSNVMGSTKSVATPIQYVSYINNLVLTWDSTGSHISTDGGNTWIGANILINDGKSIVVDNVFIIVQKNGKITYTPDGLNIKQKNIYNINVTNLSYCNIGNESLIATSDTDIAGMICDLSAKDIEINNTYWRVYDKSPIASKTVAGKIKIADLLDKTSSTAAVTPAWINANVPTIDVKEATTSRSGIAKLAPLSDLISTDKIVTPQWIDSNRSTIVDAIHKNMPIWNELTNYNPPTIVYGVDNNLYKCIDSNGPQTTGPQNPINNPEKIEYITKQDWGSISLFSGITGGFTTGVSWGYVNGKILYVAVNAYPSVPVNTWKSTFSYSFDSKIWQNAIVPDMPSGTHVGDYTSMFWDVAFGDGKFIAIGPNNGLAYMSYDGVNWKQISIPVLEAINRRQSFYKIVYGNGRFVGCSRRPGDDGYYQLITSTDGINWNTTYMNGGSISYDIHDLKFDGVRFVALHKSSYHYNFSEDGISWSGPKYPWTGANNRYLMCVDYIGNTVYAFYKWTSTSYPSVIMKSIDGGDTWENITNSSSGDMNFSTDVLYSRVVDGTIVYIYAGNAKYTTDLVSFVSKSIPSITPYNVEVCELDQQTIMVVGSGISGVRCTFNPGNIEYKSSYWQPYNPTPVASYLTKGISQLANPLNDRDSIDKIATPHWIRTNVPIPKIGLDTGLSAWRELVKTPIDSSSVPLLGYYLPRTDGFPYTDTSDNNDNLDIRSEWAYFCISETLSSKTTLCGINNGGKYIAPCTGDDDKCYGFCWRVS